MASDDLLMRQRNALGAQTKSSTQRPGTQFGSSSDDIRESQRGSRAASVLALQSQLAQVAQSRPDNASPGEVLGEQYLVFSLLERDRSSQFSGYGAATLQSTYALVVRAIQ